MNVQKISETHKSGGVVVPDGFGITICLKDWVGLNNLIFESSSLKTKKNKTKWQYIKRGLKCLRFIKGFGTNSLAYISTRSNKDKCMDKNVEPWVGDCLILTSCFWSPGFVCPETWAKYWITFLVFSVLPAPDSPLSVYENKSMMRAFKPQGSSYLRLISASYQTLLRHHSHQTLQLAAITRLCPTIYQIFLTVSHYLQTFILQGRERYCEMKFAPEHSTMTF